MKCFFMWQTIWIQSKTEFTYGSPPIGLEFQNSFLGMIPMNFLKDAVFKKLKLLTRANRLLMNVLFLIGQMMILDMQGMILLVATQF